ncbi:hypothetical protein [Spiroplasma turonicum]|uniref:Uncharacterized protein n=1 Tax=Spiroplasma turonicum TaxID=216946 RepID=A0A0K1P5D9_9MOLU|nr:hypothetical protein [Spiroplasma turonicum]AKU79493.1 hypothetical protein STURON_00247 [Spiroplasma turonicum]ALX70514.1 hypothetical protein STURO_v1c02460 [Spiroplasma turonicum]
MEEIELLKNKIKELEDELSVFKTKEDYLNTGIDKVKGIYEVTRQNAEKIIFKAVSFAYSFKEELTLTLKKIKSNPSNYEEYVNELLNKNSHLLDENIDIVKNKIQEIVIKIINSK